ncbi:putative reverse transcriptase domain-containing protein [Tanacetum coccineum]
MDACDQVHSKGILLWTTVMAQQSEIVDLQAADRRRQTVILELLKADYRRQRQLVEALKIVEALKVVKSLKTQMIELQRQQGPAKDPAEQSYRGGKLAVLDWVMIVSYCQGTEGVVNLTQWFERMETVFRISNCTVENQVKFATCTLMGTALTWWNSHARTVTNEVAYAMTWSDLKKKMTTKYCPRNEIKKVEAELWNLKVQGTDVCRWDARPDFLKCCGSNSKDPCKEAIEMAIELMDRRINTLAERQTENKEEFETLSNITKTTPYNGRNTGKGLCCRKGNGNGVARAYAVGVAGQNPDNNVVTGTFLLNNRCASILFDTGADRSFVSTQFSALINIAPTTLDHGYNVELADGRIIWVNTVLLGCTLNFLNHPFHVDLMPVEMGTYDVIIGMDWLTKYQAVIDCAKKIVRIPFGSEILIFHGDGSRNKCGTRLNIISCTKAQKYLLQGCHVFLAHITIKETGDKSKKKQLQDVPIVKNFPEVFPEDLPGLPPTRQVEFHIDLVPGAANSARAPYRLVP